MSSDACGPECGGRAEVPIVCTLPTDERHDRAHAWTDVLASVQEREATATGVRLRFDAHPRLVSTVADLAVREAECCSFFSFSITINARDAWLVVDAPADARPVLDALFA